MNLEENKGQDEKCVWRLDHVDGDELATLPIKKERLFFRWKNRQPLFDLQDVLQIRYLLSDQTIT